MGTNRHEYPEGLLHKELVFRIVGCAFEVLNEVGHGLHEKPYENAMVIGLSDLGLEIQQQSRYPILFRGRVVGEYVPDLIVAKSAIVDTKVIEKITDHERGQMLNYLRISDLRVGLILNFKHAKLEWERLVL